jgi:hypothetical protein
MSIPTWTAVTVKALNDEVQPSTFNGRFYRASNTGAAEPTWGTTVGGTTADGNITWTCYAFPIRHRILKAIDTRLKAVLKAGEYNTNLGQNVFEWRETDLQEAELPGVKYRDKNNETVITVGKHLQVMPVTFDLYWTGTAEDIRKLIADLIKAIGTDITWGGLAEDTTPPGDSEEIRAEQNDKKIWHAQLKFTVEYLTDPWDPFTNL